MSKVESTLSDRGRTHGRFEDNARISQQLKSFWRSHPDGFGGCSGVEREALDMIATKIARIISTQGGIYDDWLDIAGYATLVCKDLDAKGEIK